MHHKLIPSLHKPNIGKSYSIKTYPEKDEMIKQHKCADCGKKIVSSDFKDKLSKKEYECSGLCQDCQDKIFG